jgi:hypothetical protein
MRIGTGLQKSLEDLLLNIHSDGKVISEAFICPFFRIRKLGQSIVGTQKPEDYYRQTMLFERRTIILLEAHPPKSRWV